MDQISTEIIRLLKALVNSVNEVSQMLKENNDLIKQNQDLIKQTLQKSGSSNIEGITDAIKDSVDSLQKGIQVLELQRAVQDIRQMMGLVSTTPVSGAPISQSQPVPATIAAPIGQPQALAPAPQMAPPPQSKDKKKSDEEDSLLKPSDLFG